MEEMRLIDADAFIASLNKYVNKPITAELCATLVEMFPTAYDVEKVEAELDELKVKTTSKIVESKEVPEWFYEVKTGEYINKKDTIDIIRKGGIK